MEEGNDTPALPDTLVLSGGATKGFITLGSLQCIYDQNLHKNFKYFIGTSSGAMICYFLAIGYSPIEIMVYICTRNFMEKLSQINIVSMINGTGAASYNIIQEQLEKMTIDKIGYYPTLLDLKEKFGVILYCVTHNFTEEKTEYLSYITYPNLPCITALRMSSNLPFIFDKYKYGNSFYIDGGISDNFAIDFADKIGEKILGILLQPEIVISDMNNTLEYIYKLMFIPIIQALEYKINNASSKCQVVKLKSSKFNFLTFSLSSKDKLELFSSGYQQMKEIQ